LRGENRYCKREFDPLGQYKTRDRGGNRYTQLNFCYGVHKTMECRLLPLFRDVSVAVSAVKNLLKFVDDWVDDITTTENNNTLAELALTEDIFTTEEEEYQIAV
jgi:hypothetical protein